MKAKITHASLKKFVNEYAKKIWDDKEIDALDTFVHQDVIIHSLLGDFHGAHALKNVVQAWLTGFPDLRVTNDSVIAENDMVSVQWSAKGTHRGEFKGRLPTGNAVSYRGVTVFRIKEGRITEYWAYLDMLHLLSQI